MIEQDIAKLDIEAAGRTLERLERDVWAGVDARRHAALTSGIIVSCQAAVLVLGFVLSAVAGAHFVTEKSSPDALKLFSTGLDLSPSARLTGLAN
jgi:hypothetical protein